MIRPTPKRPLAMVVLLLGLFSLAWADETDKPKPKEPTRKQLESAPTVVPFAGEKLVLSTFLWRSKSSAVVGPDKKPSKAGSQGSLMVRTSSDQAVPRELSIRKVWLIRGNEVWTAPKMVPQDDASDSPLLVVHLKTGPDWPGDLPPALKPGDPLPPKPKGRITAVVELADSKGKTYRLRAEQQVLNLVY